MSDHARIALILAEHVTGIVSRREGEPIDVCRFHRELADAILDAYVPDAQLVEALDELHSAGLSLARHVGHVPASVCVRWDDAMTAGREALERETDE